MSLATIKLRTAMPTRVVKQPARRDDKPDVWCIELGAPDEHNYAPVALYLTREECEALIAGLQEAL